MTTALLLLLFLPLFATGSAVTFVNEESGFATLAVPTLSQPFTTVASGGGTAREKILAWFVCFTTPSSNMAVIVVDMRDGSNVPLIASVVWQPPSQSHFLFAILVNSGPGAGVNLTFSVVPPRVEWHAFQYSALPAVSFRLASLAKTETGQTLQMSLLRHTTAVAGELVNAVVLGTNSMSQLGGDFTPRTAPFGDESGDAAVPVAGATVTCTNSVNGDWAVLLVALVPADEVTNVAVATSFTGDAVISGTVSAGVSVAKSLLVRGNLTVASGVSVTVGETLVIDGQLSNSVAIAAKDVVLNSNTSSFRPPMVTSAPSGSQIVFPIAAYSGTVTGSFRSVGIVETSFSTSSCYSFSQPTVTALSGTLSAIFSVQTAPQCVGQSAAPAAGLSGGAIAGIVIGCSVLIAAVAVAVLVIYRSTRRRRDRLATVQLQMNKL